ncbi:MULTISPECIES: RHS repeat-associated core domain-containing protein [Catenuloplanes]|uniref:RHS repeat-associated protein n=1 Tax=Catenuloplanes niger TaxID=587534 RepID=A0AAE3ZWY4_9ACTN|nr:RHS repeat-associated core domain-containing protein [Catenuloplanes niger]MDR7326447.1 RHS repeat-associated protein [Catenuloplanes niger]
MRQRRFAPAVAGVMLMTSVVVAPQGPATAAARPDTGAERTRPAQQASPGAGGPVALSTSATEVAMAAGPISVPKGTGPGRNATLTSFALTDRVTLDVNVGSGNLLVRTTDLTLPGIAENELLGSVHNSLFLGSDLHTGSLGPGWRTRTGVDVRLIEADDDSVTYVASDGVVGRFTSTGSGYTAPGEFKATLAADGTGWRLTEHETGRELYFTAAGLLDRVLDRNDNVTDYTYDGSGRLTAVRSARGSAAAREVQVSYANGRIAKIAQTVDGVQARRVEYNYTAAGDLAEICSGTERDVRFEYDTQHRITKIISGVWWNEPGAITTLTYDSAHRVTSVSRLYGTTATEAAVTRFAYPSASQTLVADANTDLSQAVAAVPHTTYTLNGEKRVTRAVDAAGKVRERTYNVHQDVQRSTDALGNESVNTFGANGGQSLTESATATGASVQFSYANAATPTNPTGAYQPSSSQDAQGNTSTHVYNGAGNRLSTADALAAEAKVEYNADGTVAKTIDPGNGTNGTVYTYNADKQLIRATPPTGNSLGVRDYTYDRFGRLRTATDGAGRTTTYEYDLDDRVTKVSYSDGSTAVSYTYDGAGNVYARQDADGYQNFWYDRLNRLVERGATLWYAYDAVGNLIQLSDRRGDTFYTYDVRNLLTAMQAGDGRYTFGYDDEGRRTYTRLSVAQAGPQYVAETRNAYDRSGRLARTTTTRWQRVNGTDTASVVHDVSYCYAKRSGTSACSTAAGDDTGLRQWQTDHHRGGAVTVHSFDGSNRLTRSTNINGRTYDYGYDANGNRQTEKVDGVTVQSLSFNSANQVTTGGFGYDGAGNQTDGGAAQSATYNAGGQTRAVAGSTLHYAGPDQVELSYTQGPSAKDLWWGLKDRNGQSVLQFYQSHDGQWRHIERDGDGNALGHRTADHHYFYVLDGLGSVVGLIDDTGALAGSRTYDPYGKVIATAGGETGHTVLGYAAGLVHGDLTKFGKRWYDAGTGRFTQQDSLNLIGDPAQGNRYAYAGCNPVNYVDPTGQAVCSLVIQTLVYGLGAAAFAAIAAAGGGVILGVAISASTAGGIAAGLTGAGVTAGFLSSIFCD